MFERVRNTLTKTTSHKLPVDVFLRTCCRTGIEHPTDPKSRCVSENRIYMLLKCAQRLATCLEHSKHDVKLWIIDDHSTAEFLQQLTDIFHNINYVIEPLSQTGFNASAVRQGELCRQHGRDIVYMVEDDYLHDENCLDIMVASLATLEKSVDQHPCAIFPYDCVDRYQKEFPQPCRIFYTEGLYWRTNTKSSNTVLMRHKTFLQTYHTWYKLFSQYDPWTLSEDHTINRLWSNMVDYGGTVVLFSPIPSLAVHLEHQEPTSILHGLVNWREKWQNLTVI